MTMTATLEGPNGPKPKKRFDPGRILVYVVLVTFALYFLVPLYVMVVTSLKTVDEIRLGNVFSLPQSPTVAPWIKAWTSACTGLYCEGLSPGFWKSVRITVPSVVISVLVGSLNGYALANWRFRGSETLFVILLIGNFLPYQIFLYPLARLTSNICVPDWVYPLLGMAQGDICLYSTVACVVVIHTIFGMPLLTLLFRNYFASLPTELFKAARVDGAGFWRIFLQIMLPMSLPIFFVAIILQVTGIWNDFLFGLVFAGQPNYPMTVQLNNIFNSIQGVREYNVDMAATILTALVPLSVYFFSGRLFVRGIAAGAVKG